MTTTTHQLLQSFQLLNAHTQLMKAPSSSSSSSPSSTIAWHSTAGREYYHPMMDEKADGFGVTGRWGWTGLPISPPELHDPPITTCHGTPTVGSALRHCPETGEEDGTEPLTSWSPDWEGRHEKEPVLETQSSILDLSLTAWHVVWLIIILGNTGVRNWRKCILGPLDQDF